jgi:hypothetical protein
MADVVLASLAGGRNPTPAQAAHRRLRALLIWSLAMADVVLASLALWTDFPQDRAVLNLAPRKLDATSRKASYVA